MGVTDFVEEELARLEASGRLRVPETAREREQLEGALSARGRRLIDVCSNDYLGLGREDVSRETALASPLATGSGASRLVHGTHPAHDDLEAAFASWLRYPATLLFSSGYAANVGLLSAIAGAGDLIVSDALNHASLIDGCRLSRATVAVVPHLDLEAMARALRAPARRRFLVTEAYYSMDGDGPDLAACAALASAQGAVWILDEAHSLGVFGPEGRGLAAAAGVTPDLLVGTLGKAFGLHGAFIASSTPLRTFLWNRARSFVFSTAPSPLLATLCLRRLRDVQTADAARTALRSLSEHAHRRLRELTLATTADRPGPILPILLGSSQRALAVAHRLRQEGFLAQAIRPPTVPDGTARLRLVLRAPLSLPDLDALLELTAAALRDPTASDGP